MKASYGTVGLAAAVAFAASGACFADVGLLDGGDAFANFQSTKSRAAVQQEYLDAKAQGLLPRSGNAEFSTPQTSGMDIGARGPAGSRYQARTREEVIEELHQYQRTPQPRGADDIYFGE
ncbi:DUF4148 domain-containing protein [Noviherbaspirillum aerium]|uniref:DUF4148 domain-containing protein n=1 Tax=Noviherbaspirillum aerium TaxID=2588497 RepID=UPI00124C4EF7|nr:DUF4148 domain-containing protein [Noviherbaspirillum aerium]